jgi:hypothetical protein
MIPLGVKTCGETEFDIFEAKNASLIQGRLLCIEAKSSKMRFLPKNDPFWGKNVRESELGIYKIPSIQEKLYIDARI